jgi:hypothetical protein
MIALNKTLYKDRDISKYKKRIADESLFVFGAKLQNNSTPSWRKLQYFVFSVIKNPSEAGHKNAARFLI